MAVKSVKIHMRSGKIFEVDTEPSDLSPEQAAKEFHDGLDFASTDSIRLNQFVFRFIEIEAFEFCE